MRYHELLEAYKNGRLTDEDRHRVEADIEKHGAISEYLFEKEEADALDGYGLPKEQEAGDSGRSRQDTGWSVHEGQDTGGFGRSGQKAAAGIRGGKSIQPDFVRMVNRSIRRAFLKMGVVVAAGTLAVVLFILYLLPDLVSAFYYDPGEPAGNGNRMGLDLAVYTELCIPGYNRDTVTVQDRGYGDYDILIQQIFSYNDTTTNLAGRIEKGRLTLYDANMLTRPCGNAFAWFQVQGDSRDALTDLMGKEGQVNYCVAGNAASASKRLERLEDTGRYIAYVTLDRMMPYEDFMEYVSRSATADDLGNIWCAVCTENGIGSSGRGVSQIADQAADQTEGYFRAENLGFNCELTTSHDLDWDRDAYPYLLFWDNAQIQEGSDAGLEEAMQEEAFMKVHFISMLEYMADNEEFLAMMGMGEDPQKYRDAAAYVRENGLMVYGFAAIGEKETLLALDKEDEVYEIYTQKLK